MQQMILGAQGPVQAHLTLPGSRNITYRAILLAALAEGVSEISGMCINETTYALLNALHQLGIVTQLDEKTKSCIIAGGNGKIPKKQAAIWCDDSLFTARLLIAMCAASAGVYYFDSLPSLRKKLIAPLLHIMRRQGAQLIPNDANEMPFTLVGADTLEGGEILLNDPCKTSLATALLMISPFARSTVT